MNHATGPGQFTMINKLCRMIALVLLVKSANLSCRYSSCNWKSQDHCHRIADWMLHQVPQQIVRSYMAFPTQNLVDRAAPTPKR